MNLILALIISIAFVIAGRLGMKLQSVGTDIFAQLILLNLGLMFFNLLPLPPLDGRVFLEYLPDSLSQVRDFLMRYGSFVFLGLILLGGIGGTSPLSLIMSPFTAMSRQYLVWVATLAF
jgi:Zn-dependent protease